MRYGDSIRSQAVDSLDELVVFPQFDEIGQQLVSDNHYVIGKRHVGIIEC